jgi:hypothetical protein
MTTLDHILTVRNLPAIRQNLAIKRHARNGELLYSNARQSQTSLSVTTTAEIVPAPDASEVRTQPARANPIKTGE